MPMNLSIGVLGSCPLLLPPDVEPFFLGLAGLRLTDTFVRSV